MIDKYEIDLRKQAFNTWLRTYGSRIGYQRYTAAQQDHVHSMLHKAFNAGYNEHKRQQDPVHCGGDW